MGWLRWILLESAAVLAVVLFLLNFFLLVRWRRGGKPRALLIGIGVAIVLLAIQSLVVTRQERAAGILSGIERELTAGRLDALDAALSAGFECDRMDAIEFIDFARTGMRRVDLGAIRRMRIEIIDSSEADFVARVVYLSDVRVAELFDRLLKTVWNLTFVRESGEWRIERIRAVRVGEVDVSDIRELQP